MPATGSSRAERRSVRQRRVMVACAIAVAGLIGYGWGASTAKTVTTSTYVTTAYVGDHIFSATVDGAGFGAATSVSWYDAAGSFHERGWPECLSTIGVQQTVVFGGMWVTGADPGTAMTQVAWVDCRGR
ncbi:hypothetical protein [Lapillicoccus jejuensis]|uniref:hypothetical protein n=1 Tax=Lapillicoccus jejuensis TaxID=402171 RepID=UPI0011532F78|nr:hypothetical protein [Lapillicoccus jejuensis]